MALYIPSWKKFCNDIRTKHLQLSKQMIIERVKGLSHDYKCTRVGEAGKSIQGISHCLPSRLHIFQSSFNTYKTLEGAQFLLPWLK